MNRSIVNSLYILMYERNNFNYNINVYMYIFTKNRPIENKPNYLMFHEKIFESNRQIELKVCVLFYFQNTRGQRFYFPSEESHIQDFYSLKISLRPRPSSQSSIVAAVEDGGSYSSSH